METVRLLLDLLEADTSFRYSPAEALLFGYFRGLLSRSEVLAIADECGLVFPYSLHREFYR